MVNIKIHEALHISTVARNSRDKNNVLSDLLSPSFLSNNEEDPSFARVTTPNSIYRVS